MKKTLLTLVLAITSFAAMAQTKTYTDALTVSLDGESLAQQTSTIIVEKAADGSYTLSLNNFVLPEMPIGNIAINGVTVEESNGVKNFATEQKIVITPGEGGDFWLGPMLGEVPVKLAGKMTAGSLYCNIDIVMIINEVEQVIKVVFGTDIEKAFTYEEDLTVSVDGESLAPQRSTINVDKKVDGSYTLSLNNFVLPEMPIGNIAINGVTVEESNGVKNFATEQKIVITPGEGGDFWLGPMLDEVPVKLAGKMTDYKLYCNIDIAMAEQTINVVFGQEDLTGIENIAVEEGAKVIYDLTGRRIDAITAAGIYIVNGKKVVIK